MANIDINHSKDAVQIHTELKANGTKIEYITINDQKIGILGSLNERDREAALKVLRDTYEASNGDIYEMMSKLSTLATIDEKEITPNEMVNIEGVDIMMDYNNGKAYTMDGEEIANCDELDGLSIAATKALLIARTESALK